MSYIPNTQMQPAQPVLPPPSATGTGFGGGFKRFVFGFLLMGFLQVIGLFLLVRKNLDPMIVIYAIAACAAVQGLLLLAWLNYTAARLTLVRHVTVSGALASAVLALMLATGGWWGGLYLQGLKLHDSVVPYAWAIPPVAAGIGYWLAVKLGFKTGIFRTFLTTLVGFALPTAAVLAAGKYAPQQAYEKTEPLRVQARRAMTGLNMFNLDYELQKYRDEHQDALPADLSLWLPAGEEIPSVNDLWPARRVRKGMELLEEWKTYAAGKPVRDYDLLNDLLIAYCDPQTIKTATQPAEKEQLGRWVLTADRQVAWKTAEEFNKMSEATKAALVKGPQVRAAPPANAPPSVPSAQPKDRTVPLPAPRETPSGPKSDPGELFPQTPAK